MGAVSIDINSSERKLETMFPMHTSQGVEVFLSHRNHIRELMYFSGDYDALILLVDFEKALMETNLTVSERYALYQVYFQDRKQVDVARELNVTKQTVKTWLNRATEKIAKYYEGIGEYND